MRCFKLKRTGSILRRGWLGPPLGAGQATSNRLEGFLFLHGDDCAPVHEEIGIVGEGGIQGPGFCLDRLVGGQNEVRHQGGLAFMGNETQIIEGVEGGFPQTESYLFSGHSSYSFLRLSFLYTTYTTVQMFPQGCGPSNQGIDKTRLLRFSGIGKVYQTQEGIFMISIRHSGVKSSAEPKVHVQFRADRWAPYDLLCAYQWLAPPPEVATQKEVKNHANGSLSPCVQCSPTRGTND